MSDLNREYLRGIFEDICEQIAPDSVRDEQTWRLVASLPDSKVDDLIDLSNEEFLKDPNNPDFCKVKTFLIHTLVNSLPPLLACRVANQFAKIIVACAGKDVYMNDGMFVRLVRKCENAVKEMAE